jgi:hypothetical protein
MLSREESIGIFREHIRHHEAMFSGWERLYRGRRLMLFLFGYFDESGKFHDRDGLITLCGFISDGEHWNAFESEWVELLRKHRLSKIRMAEFYSQCRAKGWTGEKANEVLSEFVDKIRERVEFGFGIAADGKYFQHKYKIAGLPAKDPRRFCTQRLLKTIRNAFVAQGEPAPKLGITFDDDEEFSIDCYKIISRLRGDPKNKDLKEMIVNIGFAVDDIFTPLHAADILASLSRERLTTGCLPPLLERLGTPAPGFILGFDGGEFWDKAGIDEHWQDLQRADDMPRKQPK